MILYEDFLAEVMKITSLTNNRNTIDDEIAHANASASSSWGGDDASSSCYIYSEGIWGELEKVILHFVPDIKLKDYMETIETIYQTYSTDAHGYYGESSANLFRSIEPYALYTRLCELGFIEGDVNNQKPVLKKKKTRNG